MTSLVAQVPAALERVRRELVLARFVGKLAVEQGVRELRARLDASTTDDGELAPSSDAPSDAPVVDHPSGDGPDVETLALADYDHLPASAVVAKLDGLDRAERAAIEQYELRNRHRRTVLGKLDQLRELP
jgi:hypothetical protein